MNKYYFDDIEHEENFYELCIEEGIDPKGRNTEYLSLLYISAFSEVFKMLPKRADGRKKLLTELFNLEDGRWEISHPAVTSGSEALAKLGFDLFGGNRSVRIVDLLNLSDDYFEVAKQAMKIRNPNAKL